MNGQDLILGFTILIAIIATTIAYISQKKNKIIKL